MIASGLRAGLAVCVALVSCGCLSEGTRDVVGYVATAQSGSIAKLKDRRGTGPFRVYRVPPEEMFDVVVAAARKARDRTGAPLAAIFPSVLRGEVVAKERAAGTNNDGNYSDPFLTALYAVVHPVPDDPQASRVEIHATDRGPFHQGTVKWRRDMPGWIDEALSERLKAK